MPDALPGPSRTAADAPGPIAPGGASRSSNAFTLIELLAVLLIMGLVAGLTLPNLSLGAGRLVESEAQQLASLFGFARQRAVATGQPQRVVIDLDNAGYWVEEQPEDVDPFVVADPPQPDNGGRRIVRLVAPGIGHQSAFQPVPGSFGQPRQLPDAVSFESVQTLAAGELRSGQVAIEFEPDGSADAAEVVLVHENGEAWVLTLSRLADEVKLARG